VLQRHWAARNVLMVGPLVQAGLVFVIFTVQAFVPYAFATSMFVAALQFTHVFAFGLIARLEPSGRTLAATPAMMMTGAAIGPVLGGTLVKFSGYPFIGWAALVAGSLALFCFSRLPRPEAIGPAVRVVV
jgi:predicted MFS family arabinose efflux permease